MMFRHSYVELVLFFTCSSTYSFTTLTPEFVYQFVSESFNFTRDQSAAYCDDAHKSATSISDEAQLVADEVSWWTKRASFLQALLNAISVLVLTSWSDVIGRRNALLVPVIGSLLCATILAINIHFRVSLILYLASAIIYGATGGWTTLMSIATAHLSDTIDKKQRGHRYTLLEVCSDLGGGMSQIGTGYWAHHYGFLQPVIFMACCSVAALICTICLSTGKAETHHLLDDSASRVEKQEVKTTGFKSILKQLHEVIRIYTTNPCECDGCQGGNCKNLTGKSKNRVWRLWFYLLTYVVYMAAVDGYEDIMTMFLVSMPLCFSPDLVGIQAGLGKVVTLISPIVVNIYRLGFHFSNQTILMSGIFYRIVFCVIFLLAKDAIPIFVATALGMFTCITTPFIRVQISDLVSPTEQGPALALVPSVAKLVNTVSPLILLTLYPATLYILPSFIWIVIAGYFLVALLLVITVWIADKVDDRTIDRNVQ